MFCKMVLPFICREITWICDFMSSLLKETLQNKSANDSINSFSFFFFFKLIKNIKCVCPSQPPTGRLFFQWIHCAIAGGHDWVSADPRCRKWREDEVRRRTKRRPQLEEVSGCLSLRLSGLERQLNEEPPDVWVWREPGSSPCCSSWAAPRFSSDTSTPAGASISRCDTSLQTTPNQHVACCGVWSMWTCAVWSLYVWTRSGDGKEFDSGCTFIPGDRMTASCFSPSHWSQATC